MVKRVLTLAWEPTQAPQLMKAKEENMWCIKASFINRSEYESKDLPHHHGRERTDHLDTTRLLVDVPPTIWTTGPHDVGLI